MSGRHPVRVLGLITDTDRRGGQVFGVELSRKLASCGVTADTVAVAAGTEPDGLDVEVLAASRWNIAGLRHLRRRMAASDVTVAHGSSTLLACVLAGLGPGRPFVYRQISDPVFWGGRRLRRWRVRWYYRHVAHVVALSEASAEALAATFGVRRASMTVIPNAVDHTRYSPPTTDERRSARQAIGLDQGDPVVAYVGALADEKGLGDLVAAADPSWQMVLAGSGPLRAELELTASARGLRVMFLGAVDDPVRVYHAADVLVLPSWSEQQPAALVEAALCGLAVVATSVGGVPELVEDGRTGLLVPARSPGALAEAVSALVGDEGRRASMGAAGRDAALLRFTFDVTIDRWLELLARIAEVDA